MPTTCHSSLRAFRRKTPLTMADLSFLADRNSAQALGRYEQGKRKPTLQILLVYQAVCKTTIHDLMTCQCNEVEASLKARIPQLITHITATPNSPYQQDRINYLSHILTHLTQKPHDQTSHRNHSHLS